MNKIRGVFLSIAVNLFGIYGVITENQIILNIYTALTVIIFAFLGLVTFSMAVLQDKPEVQEALSMIATSKKLPVVLKWVDKSCDIALLFMLFGFGHWWKGGAWFCIHVIFSAIMKNTLEKYKKGMESK